MSMLDKEPQFEVGDIVTHPNHGEGRVVRNASTLYSEVYEVSFKKERTRSGRLIASRERRTVSAAFLTLQKRANEEKEATVVEPVEMKKEVISERGNLLVPLDVDDSIKKIITKGEVKLESRISVMKAIMGSPVLSTFIHNNGISFDLMVKAIQNPLSYEVDATREEMLLYKFKNLTSYTNVKNKAIEIMELAGADHAIIQMFREQMTPKK